MKQFALLCILFVSFKYCLCWADIESQDAPSNPKHAFHFLYVNGEEENGMKVEKLRKIFLKFEDTLHKNIGKWRTKHGDDIPNLLKFVMKDDGKLNNDLKHIMKKNVPQLHHANFLKRLNKFLGNLSKGKVDSIHFFKNAVGVKVIKGQRKKKKKKAVKYEVHSSVTIPARDTNNEKTRINHMKKTLQKHVKKWTQPSFMQFEDSNLIKKGLKKDIDLTVFTSPNKIILPVKSEVLIKCIATPKSNVSIRWKKDGRSIPHRDVSGNMYVLRNGSLYIRSLKRRDIGTYTCIASSWMEKQYATAVVAVAYLQQFEYVNVDPVKVLEGTETNIKCIPPYGAPPPTVTWKKNGKVIVNSRIGTDSWTLTIKNVQYTDAGNYTCYATNMAKQRNMTTVLEVIRITSKKDKVISTPQPDKSEGEGVIESWVGQHFTKPHHLSVEDAEDTSDSMISENINSALEGPDSSKSLQRELEQNGIGKTLLKGLLEERNELPWASNDVLSKMTEKQKKDYIEAERKWEMKLTQETQRLLDKLQPADAYIIPDVPIFDGEKSQKLKGLDAARVIKKELEEVARRKIMMTGNENWNAFEKTTNTTSTSSSTKKKDDIKRKIANRRKKTDVTDTFENKLADEEIEWLGVEKNAWSKISSLEKYLNKLKH